MPSRNFHRSQSEGLPPLELAYRRAARELRDFHRTRSLDVILEEDHPNFASSYDSNGGMLTKKRACLCLADLVGDTHDDVDGSDSSTPGEGLEQQTFAGTSNKEPQSWGHFAVDSPSSVSSESGEAHHLQQQHQQHQVHLHHPARMYPVLAHKGRTIRRFGRS
jgi:hypothetical protein